MTMKRKPMNSAKLHRLEAKGWKTGGAAEFLGLMEGEAALVEMKVSLSQAVRQSRKLHGITQMDLARRLDSSQSRIAKLEAGDPGVSLDLLVRAALAAGAKKSEVAAAIAGKLMRGID
jgi:DNA-binding XRE family transcriptional regulator